jgi:putative SOS response-associated peptidase YedK
MIRIGPQGIICPAAWTGPILGLHTLDNAIEGSAAMRPGFAIPVALFLFFLSVSTAPNLFAQAPPFGAEPKCSVPSRNPLSRKKQIVEEYFDAVSGGERWAPRYNIAPTQAVPVIRQNLEEPRREMSLICWGLVPSWAQGVSGAAALINARSETAATKPAFRDALKFRRCLVPADGFYEWQRVGNVRQPYCFAIREGELFAFAGIWESWRGGDGRALETCSILTTTANALTQAIHERMPSILDSDSYDLWLDPGMTDAATASEMLRPYDAQPMRSYPVSTRLNQVANDDPECSAVVVRGEMQSRLF